VPGTFFSSHRAFPFCQCTVQSDLQYDRESLRRTFLAHINPLTHLRSLNSCIIMQHFKVAVESVLRRSTSTYHDSIKFGSPKPALELTEERGLDKHGLGTSNVVRRIGECTAAAGSRKRKVERWRIHRTRSWCTRDVLRVERPLFRLPR
jgi:hypothetical protein